MATDVGHIGGKSMWAHAVHIRTGWHATERSKAGKVTAGLAKMKTGNRHSRRQCGLMSSYFDHLLVILLVIILQRFLIA